MRRIFLSSSYLFKLTLLRKLLSLTFELCTSQALLSSFFSHKSHIPRFQEFYYLKEMLDTFLSVGIFSLIFSLLLGTFFLSFFLFVRCKSLKMLSRKKLVKKKKNCTTQRIYESLFPHLHAHSTESWTNQNKFHLSCDAQNVKVYINYRITNLHGERVERKSKYTIESQREYSWCMFFVGVFKTSTL